MLNPGPPVSLKVPRWYAYISAGGRAVGYSFNHSAVAGWSSSGVSLERSLIQSRAQLGMAWQYGSDTALLAVMQDKNHFLVPGLASKTENRVFITVMHEVK